MQRQSGDEVIELDGSRAVDAARRFEFKPATDECVA
jgi:hypothetical protein